LRFPTSVQPDIKDSRMKPLIALTLTLGIAAPAAAADTVVLDGRMHWPVLGDSISLGDGRITAWHVTLPGNVPLALGVLFPASTLRNLPAEANDGLNCWDLNGDHDVDLHDECSGGHNRILHFGPNPTPFKWISIDWEPHGHVPEDIYGAQHFDFHFYMTDIVTRNRIAVGPCMPGTIDCAQYATAVRPVPPQYLHPDYFNTNLAFSRMGNHWADATSAEFHGEPFTNTFILGSYDGHITFYEPMVSLAYLRALPNDCRPIKQPAQFEQAGWYPTRYCVRYHRLGDAYTVSLERFVHRPAS
jgi:hypothetical protein